MTSLDKLQELKTFWTKVMPNECPLPEEFDLLYWTTQYSSEDVERAIVRSAKKMRLNLRNGVALIPQAAQRYCTSVLRHQQSWKDGSNGDGRA